MDNKKKAEHTSDIINVMLPDGTWLPKREESAYNVEIDESTLGEVADAVVIYEE